MKYEKEIELTDDFCQYLKSQNYIYKQEIRKGSYHNEGYVDIVIKNNGILVGVEAKLHGRADVVSQASQNSIRFPYSYILVPKISKKYLQICKDKGIGVIIPQDDKFVVIQKPRFGNFSWKFLKYRYFKILRNWVQDRKGRVIATGSKELPEGYSKDKLEDINPTYDWVGKQYDQTKVEWVKLGFRVYPQKADIPKKRRRKKRKTLDKFF